MTETFLFAGVALAATIVGAVVFLKKLHSTPAQPPANIMDPNGWEIGPIIGGKNYSINMPLHPAQTPDGFAIELSPGVEPHYVTFRHGPLTGKTRISMRFRIELDDLAAILYPKGFPASPAVLTVYFQQKNDDWSTDGKRWWASGVGVMPLTPGEYAIEAPLDAGWTSVERMTQASNPNEFAAARDAADRVGFVLGGGSGLGHGIQASGKARIVVTSFEVA